MTEYSIPLVYHPQRHYFRDKEEIDAAIQEVLSRGAFVMGREVPAFEAEFANYSNAKYGVAVTSGTAALHVALLAARVGPGDEVLAVANADKAMSLAAVHTGADLKWVDIDERTFNMVPEELEKALSEKTKAVIVAHMYGLPADMDAIEQVLKGRDDIVLIEDAALAVGADVRGRRAGSIGDMACFSIASSKVLGAVGAGGIVTTNSLEYYQNLNWVRNYGSAKSPYKEDDPMPKHEKGGMMFPGVNERLDTIQAAVARVKLRKMDADLTKRRANCSIFDEFLADSPCEVPYIPEGFTHSFRVYPMLVDADVRDDALKEIQQAGIQAGAHYVPPDHLHPFFLERGSYQGLLPNTEKVADRIICLPCHQYMDSDEVYYVATKTRDILKKY